MQYSSALSESASDFNLRSAGARRARGLLRTAVLAHRESALRYAYHFARRWSVRLPRAEVESCADFALCLAGSRFAPKKGAAFPTFLFFYVRAQMHKQVRTAAAATRFSGDAEELLRITDEAPAADEQIQLAELKTLLREALETLSARQRRMIELVYFEGLGVAEAADEMGVCRVYASQVKAKALEQLRRRLGDGQN